MTLAHFRMLIHEFLNKDPDKVPEEASLIIFNVKSNFCMANTGKDAKHAGNISRRVYFGRNRGK